MVFVNTQETTSIPTANPTDPTNIMSYSYSSCRDPPQASLTEPTSRRLVNDHLHGNKGCNFDDGSCDTSCLVALIQRPAITTTSPPRTTVHANTNRVVDAPWRILQLRFRSDYNDGAKQLWVCKEGTRWDNETASCVVSVLFDVNWDGCVQLNDLLAFLTAYGACPSIRFRAPRGATKPMDAWWSTTRTGMDATARPVTAV